MRSKVEEDYTTRREKREKEREEKRNDKELQGKGAHKIQAIAHEEENKRKKR